MRLGHTGLEKKQERYNKSGWTLPHQLQTPPNYAEESPAAAYLIPSLTLRMLLASKMYEVF